MKSAFAKFQSNFAKKISEVVETDLALLQKAVEKEAKVITAKVKKFAGEKGLDKKAKELEKKDKELEKFALKEYKKLEPSIHKFVKDLRENAQRVGFDVVKIEKELVHAAQAARAKVSGKKPSRPKATSTTSKTTAKAATVKPRANAPKKAPAKKASTARPKANS